MWCHSEVEVLRKYLTDVTGMLYLGDNDTIVYMFVLSAC